MQTNNLPTCYQDDILVTHIRGEVPPHVTPEYDFDLLHGWHLILLGDLHFNHKYKDYPAYYPGSPLNVTFDRDNSRKYGVDIIDYKSPKEYSVNFHDLNLPKLLRKTIKVGEEMKQDTVNHTIYEVTGSVDELSKVSNNELLDKKIASSTVKDSILDLKNKSIQEELELYLKYIQVKDVNKIITEFKNLNIS